ncbi:MAG: exopolysaccharide biosynthesis polyprenyl glycosylphosphotransferase [Anaerorhabdus sp.]|uniref:exopolysaccharide biosynthesis polyprenyl glycosylphosphotransferase n=1 Tax=Anaerorhabdus sp. TaxID=1872524 RepID=UPI002FCA2E76
MKKKMIGILSFFAEYGAVVILCLCLHFSGEYTIRFMLLYFMIQLIFGHYHSKTLLIWDEFRLLFTSHACFFLSSILLVPVGLFTINDLFLDVSISLFMLLYCFIFARYIRHALRCCLSDRVLVIGTGNDARTLFEICSNNRFSMMDIQGFIEMDQHETQQKLALEAKTNRNDNIYPYAKLEKVVNDLRIDQVVIAVEDIEKSKLENIMTILRGKVDRIKYIPRTTGLITFDSQIDDLDGLLLISSSKGRSSICNRLVKRAFDILGGIVGCILLVPLTCYVKTINVKNGDNNPVFFLQKRIGRNGKEFNIYKYRTMVPNAEALLEDLMKVDPDIKEEYLTNKKLANDPRITLIGKMLRRNSLDEFPQLINVLRGEMSLVGPRPYMFREKKDMGTYFKSIIRIKPGITGMWQSHGRSDVGFLDRLEMDDYYCSNWSIWLDVTILIKTLKTLRIRKGAK